MQTLLTGSYQVSFLCNERVSSGTLLFLVLQTDNVENCVAGFCLETFSITITWIDNENFWSTVSFLLISL